MFVLPLNVGTEEENKTMGNKGGKGDAAGEDCFIGCAECVFHSCVLFDNHLLGRVFDQTVTMLFN